MNHFDELRKLAKTKRDTSIKEVRDLYKTQLRKIDDLETQLKYRKPCRQGVPKPDTPLRVQVASVIPDDSHFTVLDVLCWLERPESDKVIIRTTIDRMIKRGDLKCVRRGRSKSPAIFAVVDYQQPSGSIDGLTQIQAAEVVLRELGRPVTLTQLIVEMIERGYKMTHDERTLKESLRSALRKQEQFVSQQGLWRINP